MHLSQLIDALNERIGKLSSWLILAAVVICTVNALIRYAFNLSSNAWLEAQWYLNSGMFLLVASYTLKLNAHVRIDVFVVMV
jgi:TRAP-type mannitol/chloroaromatic compound transport system permease small subunit